MHVQLHHHVFHLKVFSKEHFKEKAVGWLLDKDTFLQGLYGHPLAFFSTVNSDYHLKEKYYLRPAGLYMTIRFQGTFRDNVERLAKKFNTCLTVNHLQAIGNLYIMPLKNHWMTPDTNEYIYQISLQVKKL